MLNERPQHDVRFGIDDGHTKLRVRDATDISNFEDQIGIGGRAGQFVFPQTLHQRVKLVVGEVGSAGVGIAFLVGNEYFFPIDNLRRNRPRRRIGRFLGGSDRGQEQN